MKSLAAFDFDHTIIQDNTDTTAATLIPGGIPQYLKQVHKNYGWIAFMQGVFEILHENSITKDIITDVIVNMKPIDGMPILIKELATNLNYDVIIISDSNTYFINNWLKQHDLDKYILKVFTNPAEFVDNVLKIQMYHVQDYCDLSSKNLCKGQILMDFIESRKCDNILYEKVIYSGDGLNDFCPILKLNQDDYVFLRDKYKCIDLVRQSERNEIKDKSGVPVVVKAKVHVWQTGYDILQCVKNLDKSYDSS